MDDDRLEWREKQEQGGIKMTKAQILKFQIQECSQ
jgi:hypothetical protein